MELIKVDLIVVGAGPAGLAAAIEAKKTGLSDVLVIERDREPGGILEQCIHNGFGLHLFGEELTGPEYAQRFIDEALGYGVTILLNTMVLSLNAQKQVTAVSPQNGLMHYQAKAVVLAMGCRERPRGALRIPGTRPAGVMTAGAAQRFVNKEGYLPGREVVILGSGDIGLIMARRLTLEGAKVRMVCELMPYSSGLTRNIVQCLEDYHIPLRLSTTAVQIHGRERVEGVTIARVDENRKPIPGTFETISCDTLLLSVGLIPENELSMEAGIQLDPLTSGPVVNNHRETSIKGIYACGNVVHVHDLVDNVTEEARLAGRNAARSILEATDKRDESSVVKIAAGKGIRSVVPQRVMPDGGSVTLYFRVDNVYANQSIVIKAHDLILMNRRKKRLVPGEMESLILTSEQLQAVSGSQELTLLLE